MENGRLPTLQQSDIRDTRVLLRVGWDVPLTQNDRGEKIVASDDRLKETLPTIEELLSRNCTIVCLSWLGRPQGADQQFSMAPVAMQLSEMLHKPVEFFPEITGDTVKQKISTMPAQSILVLENVRFDPREKAEDEQFGQELAELCEVVVYDAFSQSHHPAASTTGLIKKAKKIFFGPNFTREREELSRILENPRRPLVSIFGGAKISDKIQTLEHLMEISDHILIGGAMANVFLAAQGMSMGKSLVETENLNPGATSQQTPIEKANELLQRYNQKISLPLDIRVAKSPQDETFREISLPKDAIAPDEMTVDVGSKTLNQWSQIIQTAETIFWNGTLGVAENPTFAVGTRIMADAVIQRQAISIVTGGDTVAFVTAWGIAKRFTFLSTSGGASLFFLSGQPLPLEEAFRTRAQH